MFQPSPSCPFPEPFDLEQVTLLISKTETVTSPGPLPEA